MTKDIQDKLKVIDAEFEQVKADHNALQEKINNGNRQLQVYKEKLIALNAQYLALNDLLPKEETKEDTKKDK